jgi:Fe-S oxidoreductase
VLRCGRFANVKRRRTSNRYVNVERSEEAIGTGANIIAAACPFCNTMLTDGVRIRKENDVAVMDVAEKLLQA